MTTQAPQPEQRRAPDRRVTPVTVDPGPVSPTVGGSVRVGAADPADRGPVLEVVLPVHDQERSVERCVHRLRNHLLASFPYPFRIVVADTASTDATLSVARGLSEELPDVEVLHLEETGRGRALRAAWSASDARVLAYTEADLSTDLAALLPLVAPLISGHSDLAIGSRLSRGARVVRGTRREINSRCYSLMLRGTLHAGFSDAQCGFKAIRADVARRLLPLVEDTGWFFDTELLVLAERAGLRIHEVPVDWVDDPDSHVAIVPTALADLRGIARVARSMRSRSEALTAIRSDLSRGPLTARATADRSGTPGRALTVPGPVAELGAGRLDTWHGTA